MDKVERYRQILQRVLEDFANWLTPTGPIKILPVCDTVRHEYLLISLGEENHRREHAIVFHARLRNGLICIEADWTEEGLSDDLIAAGVDEKDLRWRWIKQEEEMPRAA
ncbi:MAG TPA: element excision factor XisI family protein [Blastocatellia bacterium]|nr:element excision factor XisI family protein [Blastocatellia bacterium]